jgi:hypothetical protein
MRYFQDDFVIYWQNATKTKGIMKELFLDRRAITGLILIVIIFTIALPSCWAFKTNHPGEPWLDFLID